MRPAGRAPTLALPGRGHPRADLWSCRRTSTRAIRAPEAIKSIAHLVDLTRVAYGPRIANSYGYVWTWSSAQYAAVRSEEHTSELQSRPHLVCRLLLET